MPAGIPAFVSLCVCVRCGRRRNKARSRKIERALKRHFEKLSSPGLRDSVIDADSSDSDSHIDSDDDSSDRSDAGDEQDSMDDDTAEVLAQQLCSVSLLLQLST